MDWHTACVRWASLLVERVRLSPHPAGPLETSRARRERPPGTARAAEAPSRLLHQDPSLEEVRLAVLRARSSGRRDPQPCRQSPARGAPLGSADPEAGAPLPAGALAAPTLPKDRASRARRGIHSGCGDVHAQSSITRRVGRANATSLISPCPVVLQLPGSPGRPCLSRSRAPLPRLRPAYRAADAGARP